ncbi:MAG: hypothetical protein GZ091_08080 [Paludibacter sp.]|nr:hypothetical protein [Paludibacter sp.]
MKNLLIKYVFLISVAFLFCLCEADIDIHNISNEISIQPSIIIPIGTVKIDIWDFLINNKIDGFAADEENNIYFQETDTSEFKFKKIELNVNQAVLVKSISLYPEGVLKILPFSEFPVKTDKGFIDLGFNSNTKVQRIDSLEISKASLNFKISEFSLERLKPSNLQITLRFPEKTIRKLDGSSPDIIFSPTTLGNSTKILMSNFVLNTKDEAKGIPVEIKIAVKTGSTSLILDENSTITCMLNFDEIDYKVAYGYFKPEITDNQMIQKFINLNKILPNGRMKFINPQLELSVASNIGSYLSFNIEYIKAIRMDNTTVEPVYAWFDQHSSNSMIVNMEEKPKFPGEVVTKLMPTINQNWGETNALFESEIMPDVIEYKFSVSVNEELTRNDRTPQFITSDAMIKAFLKTIIPMQFNKGTYYVFEGKFDNVFDEVDKALDRLSKNNINSSSLILEIKNGLPVKSKFIIEVLDSFGNIVPTDFIKVYDINSAEVDKDGVVQTGRESNQIVSISVTKAQLKILRGAKTITYRIVIDSEQDDSKIQFTKLNTFDLKVGILVNGRI